MKWMNPPPDAHATLHKSFVRVSGGFVNLDLITHVTIEGEDAITVHFVTGNNVPYEGKDAEDVMQQCALRQVITA